MNNRVSIPELPVNVSPVAAHRRQMMWQVWVPLGISILVVLALIILTVIGAVQGSSQVERWGNISAVWVILPVLLTLLVLLIIVGASVYGMSKLLKKMPAWMLSLQLLMERISKAVRRGSDAATRPILAVNGFAARVETLWKKYIRRR